MKILVLNAGSSSLKFSLFEAEDERLLASGLIDWAQKPASITFRLPGKAKTVSKFEMRGGGDAIARILEVLQEGPEAPLNRPNEIAAVGHRIVHGGNHYSASVRVTSEVKHEIGELAELAPLHNSIGLKGILSIEQVLPDVPQFASFDTAFHSTLSETARTYPVPLQWTRDWGLRRFGFHGLSHAYCASRAAEMLGRSDLRLIIAHLGHGASISAVRGTECVDTSMGFTPLDGLMMATRSGSVDPGLLIYVLREKGVNAEQLDHILNHESGLLGVSGLSSDMRELIAAASTNPNARLAIDLYVHRIRQTIGSMAATLGGVDALVFTAGIGENAAIIRERVCDRLGFLGLEIDGASNSNCHPDSEISSRASEGRVLVIATREDLTIARETLRLLKSAGGQTKSNDENSSAKRTRVH